MTKSTPAHTPSPPRAPHAQAVGESLGEPPLHAAGGHDDDLTRERVGEGGGQQVREAVGERVGALGGVEVQGHGATL